MQIRFEPKEISDLADEALESFQAIVNCAGLGAAKLAKDNDEIIPVFGFLLHYSYSHGDFPSQWPSFVVIDESDPSLENLSYIVHHCGSELVLGGTYFTEVTENEGSISEAMKQRVFKLIELKKTDIKDVLNRDIDLSGLQNWISEKTKDFKLTCGRRPTRKDGIRIERTKNIRNTVVIHNYGHGGAGNGK